MLLAASTPASIVVGVVLYRRQCNKQVSLGAAREESAKATDQRWRKTLRYLWQVEEWIAKHMNRLRGPEDDGPLVREMIGARWGTTQQTVQNALRDRTELLDPRDVHSLILTYVPEFAKPKKGKGGRPAERHRTFIEARKLREQEHLTWPRIAKRLDPEGFKADPRAAAERLRLGVTYLKHGKSKQARPRQKAQA
jgi:hypothetical protein